MKHQIAHILISMCVDREMKTTSIDSVTYSNVAVWLQRPTKDSKEKYVIINRSSKTTKEDTTTNVRIKKTKNKTIGRERKREELNNNEEVS